MMTQISTRQTQILQLLLDNRRGLSIDDIAKALDISRTAILQHFSKLQQLNYVCEGALNKTAGRPVQTYCLTDEGINLFPKQYSWFSALLLTSLKQQMGAKGLRHYMHRLGEQVAQDFLPQMQNKTPLERIQQLSVIMQQLGFETNLRQDNKIDLPKIQARNCIYHDVAQKHEEICQFDLALMSRLLDSEIKLEECLAQSGCVCQFKISNN